MEELNKKHREDGFRVPENYFSELEENVISGLYEKKEIIFRPAKWYHNNILRIAASFILLIGLYLAFSPEKVKPDNQVSFENIDGNELSEFENSIDLNEDEFEEIIPANFIDSLYEVSFLKNPNIINDEEIIELEEEFEPMYDDESEINI